MVKPLSAEEWPVGRLRRPRADVACWQGVGGVMLLAGPGAELKGKLTEKMRFRPYVVRNCS